MGPSERNYSVPKLDLLAVVWALHYSKPYLLSQRFKLHSDHGSLRWLLNFKDLSRQMARWLDTLAELDFSIVQRPGPRHENADRMSRQFVNAVLFENRDVRDFQEAFTLYPDLCTVRDRLAAWESARQQDSRAVHALLRDTDLLTVENDWLYFMHNNDRKPVVPRSLRESPMVEAHWGTTSGHFGIDWILYRLRTAYYWPGMNTEVSVFCQANAGATPYGVCTDAYGSSPSTSGDDTTTIYGMPQVPQRQSGPPAKLAPRSPSGKNKRHPKRKREAHRRRRAREKELIAAGHEALRKANEARLWQQHPGAETHTDGVTDTVQNCTLGSSSLVLVRNLP